MLGKVILVQALLLVIFEQHLRKILQSQLPNWGRLISEALKDQVYQLHFFDVICSLDFCCVQLSDGLEHVLPNELLRVVGSLVEDLKRQKLQLLLDHLVASCRHRVARGAGQSWLRTKASHDAAEVAKRAQQDLHDAKGNEGETKAHQPDLALSDDANFVHNRWY